MVAEKKVSVVLGGGGAKGFVHLGVLQAIVDRGYDVVALYGTSIGSIIASLFAYQFVFDHLEKGKPRAEAQKAAISGVADLLLDTNFLNFADISLSILQRGLIRGSRFRSWLQTQLLANTGTDSIRFRDLKPHIDLNVTFTNALDGQSVVAGCMTSPNMLVSAAVRASMSIQGLFVEDTVDYNGTPVRSWDGGVTGNCRFDLSCANYPDILTVASSLTYRGDPAALPNSLLLAAVRPLLVANRSADFWLRQIENLTETLLVPAQKEKLLIVRPDLNGVTTTSFFIDKAKRRTLIENGRLATELALRAFEDEDVAAVEEQRR